MISSDIFNLTNIVEPFIVVNAGNSCYIDSLLMALFFSPSDNDYLLQTDVSDGLIMYLQNMIQMYFVNRVRASKSVTADIIPVPASIWNKLIINVF